MMGETISVRVTNELSCALTVYTTRAKDPTDPPSTDPAAYVPIYTSIGTVPANGTATLDTGEVLSRVVIAREEDDFPIKLFVTEIFGPSVQPVTVEASDLTNTQAAFSFYKDHIAQPYSPLALQFNEIVLHPGN